MTSVKRQIEMKKERLTRLVLCKQITKEHANESIKAYAQFVSRYFGCGAQLFDTITATNMLILVVAVLVSLS